MSAVAPKKFEYIDALRGIAILLVIATHAGDLAGELPVWAEWLALRGQSGVQLFFVASALTLYLSWHSRADEEHPLRNFFIRRLFRIAPMFWLALVGYTALVGWGGENRFWSLGTEIDWRHILSTFFFVHDWHPLTITAVVPGGWSVGVEMTFYLLFPLLMLATRRWEHLLIVLAASLVFRAASADVLTENLKYPDKLLSEFRYMWIGGQLPCFVIGLVLGKIISEDVAADRSHGTWLVVGGVAYLLGIWAASQWLPGVRGSSPLTNHIGLSAAFAVLALGLSRYSWPVLVNPLTILIGRYSFSMYLLHFVIVEGLGMTRLVPAMPFAPVVSVGIAYVAVVVITTALSAVTYRFIELPSVRAGKRLISRLDGNLQSGLVEKSAA